MAVETEEQQLTEYERRRLENIKRNGQMMASLKIQAHLSELSAISRGQKREYKKRYDSETLERLTTRRSLRTRGVPPQARGLPNRLKMKTFSIVRGPLPMSDSYEGYVSQSYRPLIQNLTAISRSNERPKSRINLEDAIDLGSMRLQPQNVAHMVLEKIVNLRFLPTTDVTMVVATNKYGCLGFWNVREEGEDGDPVYVFRPHVALVAGLLVHPFCISKVYTSCQDGVLRLMDTEKEMFDLLYSSDSGSELSSLAQDPNNANSIYFAEGDGHLNMFDTRARKIFSSWKLKRQPINSIDFNPVDTNIMATSTRAGRVYLWDLRKMDTKRRKSNALWTDANRRIYSAYFSPSGSCLAATSSCGNISVLQGSNFVEIFTIHRDNRTDSLVNSSRAIWGWDDTYLYVGSMERKVDVVSVKERKIVHSLDSPLMSSAVACRFDAHPFVVGMLAGSTSDGQVYVWKCSS